MAKKSLNPSPIAAAWGVFSAPTPSAVVTSRFVSPCAYSW